MVFRKNYYDLGPLSRDIVQARHLLQQITGTIRLVEPKGEKTLRAEYDYGIDALLADAKSLKSNAQVYVVAGGRFSTFRVQLELR